MEKFKKEYQKEIKKMSMFIPIVSRVHGSSHEEFYEVEKLFNQIQLKISENNYQIDKELTKLKQVTNNYEVPKDTCESYAYVYLTLEKLDSLYRFK